MIVWNYRWIRVSGTDYPLETALLWGMQAGFIGFMVGGLFENNFMDGETQSMVFALFGWALFLGKTIESHRRE